jgi:hypothetical protein
MAAEKEHEEVLKEAKEQEASNHRRLAQAKEQEASNHRRLDALGDKALADDPVEVALLMRMPVASAWHIKQNLMVASQRVHTVVVAKEMTDQELEQLLCTVQGSWLQVQLLLTERGAKVARWMLATYLARTLLDADKELEVTPTLGLEKELLHSRWDWHSSQKSLSMYKLVSAANAPLYMATVILTGEIACPGLHEQDTYGLLAASLRRVTLWKNSDLICKWLYEYQQTRVVCDESGVTVDPTEVFQYLRSEPGARGQRGTPHRGSKSRHGGSHHE